MVINAENGINSPSSHSSWDTLRSIHTIIYTSHNEFANSLMSSCEWMVKDGQRETVNIA